jgi:hypothetical protein
MSAQADQSSECYFITATVKMSYTDHHDETHLLICTSKDDMTSQSLRDEALEALQQLGKTGPDRHIAFGEPVKMSPDIPRPDFPPIRDAIHTQTWVVAGLSEAKNEKA